MYAMKQKSQEV